MYEIYGCSEEKKNQENYFKKKIPKLTNRIGGFLTKKNFHDFQI